MYQVTALSCRFWRKCNFACKRPKWKMNIYITGHGTASLFQPWWSVRGAIRTFDVNRCSLPGSTFCFCLLRLGLVVTGRSGWKLRNADTRCDSSVVKSAVWKSRRTSWAPATNKPTVSVDVKQHFNHQPATQLTVCVDVTAHHQWRDHKAEGVAFHTEKIKIKIKQRAGGGGGGEREYV